MIGNHYLAQAIESERIMREMRQKAIDDAKARGAKVTTFDGALHDCILIEEKPNES